MELCNPILIPVKERLKLREDNLGELVDPTNFRGMIGRCRPLMLHRDG